MSDDAISPVSGKGHRDENFPVASFLIRPRHRHTILAFYRFARAADDIADHPSAGLEQKFRLLEDMRRTLQGEDDLSAEAAELRRALDSEKLPVQHGLDLLEAFRRDVTKLRYADWGELIDYCRFSAMPVGRFVLDVHGESRDTWPASDALCAALQVINHLQDCGKDFRALNRVYIPADALAACEATVTMLDCDRAEPALLLVIRSLARRTRALLAEAELFSASIRDTRLALEVAVIQALAEDLTQKLERYDPLSERVHHRPVEAAGIGIATSFRFLLRRARKIRMQPSSYPQHYRR